MRHSQFWVVTHTKYIPNLSHDHSFFKEPLSCWSKSYASKCFQATVLIVLVYKAIDHNEDELFLLVFLAPIILSMTFSILAPKLMSRLDLSRKDTSFWTQT